jgi:cell division protein FtsQ
MKRILIVSVWMLLVAGVAVLLGFAGKEHDSTQCESLDIRIKYKSDDFFITTNDVEKFFTLKGIIIKGAALADINPDAIETALLGNPFIEKADVYIEVNGNVRVMITQRRPLARVINNCNQSFYIDDAGRLMPLNPDYSARVVVANGMINEFYKPSVNLNVADSVGMDSVVMKSSLYKIYRLSEYINSSDFWRAEIEEIFVNDKGDLELYCKVGDFKIIFGDLDNMQQKFDNLFIFFKDGLNKIGWEKYKTVNVKYTNQVVCTKF